MNDRDVWAPQRPRIFFLHLPKTAGMTLRLFFGNQYSVDQIMPANTWPELLGVETAELDRFRLFQGHFTCGLMELLPPDFAPVVFLREPVARTISHLKHLRRDPNFHPAHRLAAGRSLDDLVRDDDVMALCSNVQSALLSNYVPGELILTGLREDVAEGRPPNADRFAAEPDLAIAEATLERFDFVGFVEDLHEDLLRLSLQVGLHPPQPLPKRNFDPEGATEIGKLDPETLAILRERNDVDIVLYETAREKLSGRPRADPKEVHTALLQHRVYAPISQPTVFPMTGAIPGSNWYGCEEIENGGQRWTGPLNLTTLDLPLAPGFDFEFSLTVMLAEIQDLTVHVGETELPIGYYESENIRHRIGFWVTAELVEADRLTTIVFRTRNVFQPSAADIRSLSFLMTDLSISTVEPAILDGTSNK